MPLIFGPISIASLCSRQFCVLHCGLSWQPVALLYKRRITTETGFVVTIALRHSPYTHNPYTCQPLIRSMIYGLFAALHYIALQIHYTNGNNYIYPLVHLLHMSYTSLYTYEYIHCGVSLCADTENSVPLSKLIKLSFNINYVL